jgi:pyridoxamine 5'-phosphate oxidase
MTRWLADLRRDHTARPFTEAEADPDPFQQFHAWLVDAHGAKLPQPNAMTLSTVDEHGRPDARVVLLKALDERGLVFYTHRTSAKGRQLAANPFAALTFLWDPLDRQVRVRGPVEWTTDAESDEYFASRPRGSQLGAIASNQSAVVDGRGALDAALAAIAARAGDGPLERPASWGGYRVLPVEFEFWQGRPNRMHDRLRYRRDEQGAWFRVRLAP